MTGPEALEAAQDAARGLTELAGEVTANPPRAWQAVAVEIAHELTTVADYLTRAAAGAEDREALTELAEVIRLELADAIGEGTP